jgi:DNA-binding PadR family transcriptional regulator
MKTPTKTQVRAEIMRVLRLLERDGFLSSRMGDDGRVRWQVTEKFKQGEPNLQDYSNFKDVLD